jgi:hypothetical protein
LNGRDVVFLSAGIRIYPDTTLAKLARAEGIIDQTDTLLEPRFYYSPELSIDVFETLLAKHLEKHKNYMRSTDLQLSFLPTFQRVSRWIGLKTPLWQYATWFNRCMPQRPIADAKTKSTQLRDKGS